MTRDQTVLLALAGLAVLCLALVVTCLRLRAISRQTARELAALRERVEELAPSVPRVSAAPTAAPVEFVITDLGREAEHTQPPPVRPDAAAFADIVLKETVVKAASLAHGVRRGLAPSTRNHIRFEMKQEVRRARKQRRRRVKAAQRDLHASQRASLAEEAS